MGIFSRPENMDGWMAHHGDGCRQVPEAHATMAKGCLK